MNLKKVFAWGLTLAVAAVAVWLGCDAYRRHLSAPWTRDGQVQADVVLVAPRVSGPVLHVAVVDNQAVKAGDLLFTEARTSVKPRRSRAVSTSASACCRAARAPARAAWAF